MRQPVTITRPQLTIRPVAISAVPSILVQPQQVLVDPISVPVPMPASVEPAAPMEGPYVDYGRWLTAEGGILLVCKDLDLRFRHTLWHLFAWTVSTGLEGWFLLTRSPVHTLWINIVCLLAVAIINAIIVARPIEIFRRIEIRPDCMILDGADIFWLRNMEGGWPAFHTNEEGNQVLSGIYGTRLVEYLVARRFDEKDRMAEVLAIHLRDAMRQLWAKQQG